MSSRRGLVLSSAQHLENVSCRAVEPIVQLQAPGWRAKAAGGKQKFRQGVRLFPGEAGSGVSPITPHQAPARPSSPEHLWKPGLTLPLVLSRETKVESGVSLPEAEETVSAGPRSERGRFLPITSSSGLTSLVKAARHTVMEKQASKGTACSHPGCVGSRRFA